ncbi:MAG: FG-GAP repeat domain-containing protein [Planctomycetota bacterium]|jgi:hypothetical protein
MKHWITQIVLLSLLAGIVYAEDIPAFKQQTIQVPVGHLFGLWPYWKDINRDGLTDLLALVQRDGKVFIYNQNSSGFPASPGQSIEFPKGTAWFTLYDVSKDPDDEMLISTSDGLAFYRQNNGVFEKEPQKLIEAKQVFVADTSPIVFDPNKYSEDLKNAIPVVFPDHTIIYKCDENYQLKPGERIEHQFKKTMDKFNWNSWSLGSKKSDQIRIRIIAQDKSEDREEKDSMEENEYIRKMLKEIKGKRQQDCFIEKRDINNDGNKDVILLHLQQDIDVKTNVIIFKRREDGKLPEKPDQILRCRGLPIIGDYPGPSYWIPFFDINNDGFLDIVFMELKTIPTSVSAFFEMLASKGMDWTLTVRLYKVGKGFSSRTDFKMDFKAMLPFSENFADLINLEGDFNADGRKDLIIRRSPTQSDIYFSSLSNGFFEREPKLQFEMPAEGRTSVEDLNGDGISDIYLINYVKGRITVFLSKSLSKKGALQ